VSFGEVPAGFPASSPSHGATLSPDERELYVIDAVHEAVQVWDVSRVDEGVAPSRLGVIPVANLLHGIESSCAYECQKGGWLQHSLDGRFVYVGDSGEVIDTATRKVITTLAPLAQTKKCMEIDWQGGVPIATTQRTGVGYAQ
jgi:DNA-binding beta-propeller fold protein YncE